MKFLVTGGCGFIGSNLVEELLNQGNEVVVLDNLHTGSLENLKGFNIELIKGNSGEISNLSLDVDGIFHLGMPSSSPMYKENPSLVGKTINEFINIMEFARKNKIKVIYASSSSIYNGLKPPHKENMEIKVTDYYTETRLCIERMAKLYYKLHGVKSIGLRLFSVYGPKEKAKGKYANLVSQFLWALQKKESPIIYGDGSQTRDFIYVKDVVDAFILAMSSKIKCDIFNIGTGKSISLNQLVGMLNKILKTNTKPKYIKNPIKNYVQHTQADPKKAEKILGFKAKYNLEEGIKKIISED